ncbi:hypothetical protein [Halotalea alkalilenta]|uniref:Uncharacterized protein n=1 Tax=Halotalea alkalilenta TaxID=376489 RepID=A0A172YHY2_9GAMM|nr:hypothetical protein [Halotalea alkalilenta]ANF58752.1 hypothetical protein A5892_15805 [Halotalea alkalilenta]
MAASVDASLPTAPNPASTQSSEDKWVDAVQSATTSKQTENASSSETPSPSEAEADASLNVDDIRDKYDIPDFTGDGLMETKLHGSTTVGQKAAEQFIERIRNDVDDSKLDENSDEAKLVDLLDAQGATDNGYELYGYVELIESGGSTYRESQTDPTRLTGDDVTQIVDEEKLAKQISELMQEDGISKRYDQALKDAIEGVDQSTRDEIADKVDKALFEDDGKTPNLSFEDYVIAIKAKASKEGDDKLSESIQSEVDHYFEALQALDPERYKSRKQAFDQNMMTHQLDGYMSDPSSIKNEHADTGLRSTIDIVQHGINGALQSLDKGSKAYDQYKRLIDELQLFSGKLEGIKEKDGAVIYRAMMYAARVQGADSQLMDKVVDTQLKELSGNRSETAGALKKVLSASSSSGTLGAMTGTMSLVSAGVQLSHGGWEGMSADDRVAAVRDLVGGLSFTNDFARFGSNIITQLSDKNGKPRINAAGWLGLLDDNFPDIFRKNSSADVKTDAVAKKISEKVNDTSDEIKQSGNNLSSLSEEQRRDYEKTAEALGKEIGATSSSEDKPYTAKRVGLSFLRYMGGAGLDTTGGVMDIVTGVNKLKNADSELERAGAGLSIGGGSSTTAMAIANTVSMFSSKGSHLAAKLGSDIGTKVVNGLFAGSRFAGPVLGVVGAVFGIVGSVIAEAINHKKMQKLTDSQGQFFKDLSGYGVTKDDWGDKLEYARYAAYMYGGRDAPDDQSIFDYQKQEWQHFQDTEGKRGSSLARLAPYLHKDGDFGRESLWEKHLQGGTTRMTAKDHISKSDDWRPFVDTDLDVGEKVTVDEYRRSAVSEYFDADFYREHEKSLQVVDRLWDEWNGKDDIVSKDDLEKIKDDESKSQEERDAARFLYEQNDFFDALDTLHKGGDGDGKISTNDRRDWLDANEVKRA